MKRRELLKGLAMLALPLPSLGQEPPLQFTFAKEGIHLTVTAGDPTTLRAGELALEPAWRTRSLIAVDLADLAEFCGGRPARAEATFLPGYGRRRLAEAGEGKAFWA